MAKLDLAPTVMRGRTDLQEAALINLNEVRISDDRKATDQKCSFTSQLRRGCSAALRARRSVGRRVVHPEATN